ncbi:MAG TPA: 5-oxoprolinase subunit PxpB [Gammaproteobacteria bacterium]|nr:5-oxoprolinase subunit PxpB [Gammaproteobacteria bacterium]
MNIRSFGDAALLIELPDAQAAQALCQALLVGASAGIEDVVPGFQSLLIRFDPLKQDAARLAERIRNSTYSLPFSSKPVEHEIGMHYDGPDLSMIVQASGLSVEEIVHRHSRAVYRVAFIGFAPGFPYLTGLDPALHLPRHKTPRVHVPAGAVAIADQFCGIYPRSSPGGWHLIGTTDASLFDADRDAPCLLSPGDTVRFRALP